MICRRDFFRKAGTAMVPAAAAAFGQIPPEMTTGWGMPDALPQIRIASEPQLFCDDFLLATGSAEGRDYPVGIRFAVGPALKDPSPVMLPGVDAPWEKTGMYWICVLHDAGRYRCWYNSSLYTEARPEYPYQRAIGNNQVVWMVVSYAESDDGIQWRKPRLNLIEIGGSKENNICFLGDIDRYAEGGCVFIDPSAKADERYKMVFAGLLGLRGAVSPDGLSWKLAPGTFEVRGLDTQNVATYDPALGRYVAYIRSNNLQYGGRDVGTPVQPTKRGRAVARMESIDFRNWSPAEIVLSPDIEDGLDLDFYNGPYSRYRNVHWMLLSAYHHWQGNLNLQAVVSRDNRQWLRPTRSTLVDNGLPGSFDEFRIYAGPGILPAGKDHLAIYTRSGQGPHPGSVKRIYNPGPWKSWQGTPEGCMGRIRFKRDRLVGIEAGDQGGNFATRELIFSGKTLQVNAEPVGPNAEVRVQLVQGQGKQTKTVPGRTFEDSIPFTTDQLDGTERWKGGAELGAWAGKPIRLHFHLKNARIYGFQFS